MANKTLKDQITDIIDEYGYSDFDACCEIADCMSEENLQKYLDKFGYENFAYAYDDNNTLAYDLVDAMSDDELIKCNKLIQQLKEPNDATDEPCL